MPGTVEWIEDYEQGLERATKDGKMLFVDLTADW